MPQRDAKTPPQALNGTFRPPDNSPSGRHFTRNFLLCGRRFLLPGMNFCQMLCCQIYTQMLMTFVRS